MRKRKTPPDPWDLPAFGPECYGDYEEEPKEKGMRLGVLLVFVSVVLGFMAFAFHVISGVVGW